MAEITINFPTLDTTEIRNFVVGKKDAAKIFNGIENLGLPESNATPAIEPPRRNSLKADLQAASGIWANRPETGEEIAMQIRKANRRQ
jgi:hypothetical protein